MFAVIVYFWYTWRGTYVQTFAALKKFAGLLIFATALTGVEGCAGVWQNPRQNTTPSTPHGRF
jgi:hypothetical protein